MGKIACTSCGEWKGVRPEILKKRIEWFSSEKQLRENYRCRKCRTNNGIETPDSIRSGEHLVIETLNNLTIGDYVPSLHELTRETSLSEVKVISILKKNGIRTSM